ncbi:MAG: TolC family protein [Candidatus Zixiibacteriota bacterium]
MKSRRRLQYAIMFVLLPVILFRSADARVLTIDQAVQEALIGNQDYQIARTELEKAEAEIQAAAADVYPHLSLGSTYTRNLEIPELVFGGQTIKLGTENQIDAGLTLKQSIWQGGKALEAIKIARTYREYTKEAVREVEAEIVFNVRQSFLDVILARDVVNVFRDALAAAELNLDIVSKMQSQGVVSEYEKLRAEVEVANLRPQLMQAQNQAALALHSLRNFLSLDLSEELELQYNFDSTTVGQVLNLPRVTELAIANRSAIQQQEHLKEITSRAVRVAAAERSPKFDFVSQYGWRYQADDFGLDGSDWSPNWTASISLSMPIFDGFATKASVRKAKVDKRQAELGYEKITEQVELQVRDAILRYSEANARLLSQRKTIEQAEEGLRISRIRYQNGIGTQLEILSSESALTLARSNYVQATHDAALAVYRLLRVTGIKNFDELKEQ